MRVVFVTSTLSESHLLLHDDALTSLFRKMILLDDRCEIKAESDAADDWHDDITAP